MLRIVPSLLGLILFVGYTGFLAYRIGAPPLIIIVVLVAVMAAADLVVSARRGEL
jgi:hypothetical protein